MKRMLCWLAAVTAVVVAGCTAENQPTAVRRSFLRAPVAIDSHTATLDTARQMLKGWGMYPSGGPGLPPETVATLLYQSGVTFIRDQVDPTMYDSGTTYPVVINTGTLLNWETKWQDAKTHTGSTVKSYILSVWSPPAAFKTNDSTNGYNNADTSDINDSSVIGYLIGAKEGAFVAYLVTVLKDLKSSSVGLPMALSVQNEPLNLVHYPGCLYRGTNGALMYDSVAKNLRGGLNFVQIDSTQTKLIGPETANYAGVSPFFGTYPFKRLQGDSNYLNHAITNFAFHTYFQGDKAVIDSTLTGMAAAQPLRDSWMTEYSDPAGSGPLDYVLNTFSDMGAALVIVPNNYWSWYQGWNPSGPKEDPGVLITGSNSQPLRSKRYYALAKVWTSLVPNQWKIMPMDSTTDPDLRIALGTQTSGDPQVDLWAFSKTDGTEIVVMVANHTTKQKSLTIGTFPSTYTAQHSWLSDSTHDMWQDTSKNVYHQYSTIHSPPRSFKFVIMQ